MHFIALNPYLYFLERKNNIQHAAVGWLCVATRYGRNSRRGRRFVNNIDRSRWCGVVRFYSRGAIGPAIYEAEDRGSRSRGRLVRLFGNFHCFLANWEEKKKEKKRLPGTLAWAFDRFLPTYRLLRKSLYLRAVLSRTRSTCKCRAIKEQTTQLSFGGELGETRWRRQRRLSLSHWFYISYLGHVAAIERIFFVGRFLRYWVLKPSQFEFLPKFLL